MTLANALANVAVNDTLYTLNKGRYEVGKIGENDLLKSELALLRARAAVDDANLARDRAEAALRRMLNVPRGPGADDRHARLDPDRRGRSGPRRQGGAARTRASIGAVAARRCERARARSRSRSSNNGFNASVPATRGFNQTASAFGEAYQSPLGTPVADSSASTLPMVQWGAGHADVEAAQGRRSARVATNNKTRRDALAEDARFSVLAASQAQRNVVLAAKADTVSVKQFEVARNRYIIGKISNTDLYNAQSDKDNAVLAYVQALRNYWIVLLPPAPCDAVRLRDQAGTGR